MANITLRRSVLNKRIQSVKDYPINEKEQEKPLFLIMQKVWFDQIENGSKTEEFRDGTDHYKLKFFNRDKKTKEPKVQEFQNCITARRLSS